MVSNASGMLGTTSYGKVVRRSNRERPRGFLPAIQLRTQSGATWLHRCVFVQYQSAPTWADPFGLERSARTTVPVPFTLSLTITPEEKLPHFSGRANPTNRHLSRPFNAFPTLPRQWGRHPRATSPNVYQGRTLSEKPNTLTRRTKTYCSLTLSSDEASGLFPTDPKPACGSEELEGSSLPRTSRRNENKKEGAQWP